MHLRLYDDILPIKTIYSLLLASALHAEYFGVCSNALARLEKMHQGSDSLLHLGDENDDRDEFESLAFTIFNEREPQDPAAVKFPCSICATTVKESYAKLDYRQF
jgi:hypothetical protein